ncbi:hypothetical protein M527_18920 [Sphingobium indicum IP26]|uniref:Lipoprotein SmpA/OmlA domain-containing protein n=1 Tax=Sphingobium indicum F2 TaxID=1450518 RepID=A0A8E1C2T0_9SPHN|nr:MULTISPECIES: hypothetical protein [Sphingobium]EPR16975.1 hypothetical protein M527_18920 [Sphingobium indicum IP26]EQB04579.1 hypothetical protein L286_10235 [Sphingobium sp. HDIP04]KER36560.1 hypothetical protein AL00_10365 [Sphingobium indicum F2]
MTRPHPALVVASLLTLAACGGVVPPPATQIARPPAGPPASAFTRPGPLIGSDAKQLMRLFGQPRLDIRESAMRKLQFANGRCVLDAYLYLPPQGKEPLVTHVDARTPTGTDVDAASCSAALQAK